MRSSILFSVGNEGSRYDASVGGGGKIDTARLDDNERIKNTSPMIKIAAKTKSAIFVAKIDVFVRFRTDVDLK